MKCTDPGHTYVTEDGQVINFIKKEMKDGVFTLIHSGTTNEELLEVLIHRTEGLNAKFPCLENDRALVGMCDALAWFNLRTRARQAQGVEATPQNHKPELDAEYYASRRERSMKDVVNDFQPHKVE